MNSIGIPLFGSSFPRQCLRTVSGVRGEIQARDAIHIGSPPISNTAGRELDAPLLSAIFIDFGDLVPDLREPRVAGNMNGIFGETPQVDVLRKVGLTP